MPRPGMLFSLIACLLSQPLLTAAQTVNISTGAVDGRVTDHTGAVLPGVTIAISGDALMRQRTTLTDSDGFYRFPALPPGEYALVFDLDGFTPARRESVHIGVGFTATIDIAMELATLQERVIVVRQSPVVDRQSTAIATSFGARQLANMPGARNMLAILIATPGVQLTRFDVGGNTASFGSENGAFGTMGNNRPMLEGIDTTGVQGTGFVFDYGSLDEVLVSTAAHPAEWPKPGVQMQFIAKSGGNQYRGTLYADYENRAWQSVNVDEGQIARGAPRGGGLSPRDANRLWGYRDFNADVGGFVRKDALWWYSSFRDQEVEARYLNFPVRPYRIRVTNYSGKATYQATAGHSFVGYVQAGRNHQPNSLTPSGLTGLSASNAINEAEESTSELRSRAWVLKGEWNAVVADRFFAEVRAGQFGSNRRETPNSFSPRFEDVTTLTVRGGNRDFIGNLRRNQLFGSLSHFKDGWAGNHHFKAGGEAYRSTQADTWNSSYPGDVLHVLRNEVPQEVFLFQTPSRSDAGFWAYAAHASDSWRVNDRMTLNLGLRFDRYRMFLPAQEQQAGRFNPTAQSFAAVDNLIDWNILAPRIGVVVDPHGEGRTLLKFSYGHYSVTPGIPTAVNLNPNSGVWWRRYTWSDSDGSGVWAAGEENRLLASRGGVTLESLDPAVALPFVREVAGWVERELGASVGARAGLVWRGGRQNFQRQNVNQPFTAFAMPVAIADPGPDGTVNTGDDGLTIEGRQLLPEFVNQSPLNVVRNVPNSDNNYWTLDFTASKRFDGTWSLVSGFAHTWSREHAGTYFGEPIRQNPLPLSPNDLINTGSLGRHEFTVWSAKLLGTYQAPGELLISPLLRHQSGQPFGRTFSTSLNYGNNVRILAEPIGTRRMDNVTILDVRVEKAFRHRLFGRVAVFVDVFNALNANPEQNTSWSSGSFLRPLNIVAPRIARIGGKLEW